MKTILFKSSLRIGIAMLSLLTASLLSHAAPAVSKPNIVFILADDLGLLRPRLLRRRDRDAEPRRPRPQRPALHPVLQHRPLLAHARRAAHRLLRAADSSRRPAGRARRHAGRAAAVGALAAGLPQARRLPQLSQRQVAHRRQGARRRVRPLAQHEQPGELLQRRGQLRSTTSP